MTSLSYVILPQEFDNILSEVYIAGYSDSTRRASGKSASIHNAKKKLFHSLSTDNWTKIHPRVEDLDSEQSDDLILSDVPF